jgi:hypothetical protein
MIEIAKWLQSIPTTYWQSLGVLALASVLLFLVTRGSVMRGFGWFLVLLGLVVGLGYPVLALKWSAENVSEWSLRETKDAAAGLDMARLRHLMDMTRRGLVPSWTQVSPWPGVALGGGLFALGVLVLAVRRPERDEEPPEAPEEPPEFKWRKR